MATESSPTDQNKLKPILKESVVLHYLSLPNNWDNTAKQKNLVEFVEQLVKRENPSLSDEDHNLIFNKVRMLIVVIKQKWDKNNRTKIRFLAKEAAWLKTFLHFDRNENESDGEDVSEAREPEDVSKPKRGRPSVEYEGASSSTKYQQIGELKSKLATEPLRKIIDTAKSVAKDEKNYEVQRFLFYLQQSPMTVSNSLRRIETREPKNLSPEEALCGFIETDLTVEKYEYWRKLFLSSNNNSLPPYKQLQKAKELCRPSKTSIEITETEAIISLQALLDHTTGRILELQKGHLLGYCNELKITDLTLSMEASWGFDGSTGHSQYKQTFTDSKQTDDGSLFTTVMIPLRIAPLDNFSHVLWNNPSPQSVRYCRPLRMKFTKETVPEITTEKNRVDGEIERLSPFEFKLEDDKTTVKIKVQYNMWMTIIDGKVLSVITGTKSAQVCPICNAKPTEMNMISKPALDMERLTHGISPLHCWIRCYEFCLHLSYRLGINKWRISKADDKKYVETRKNKIVQEMRDRLGLLVDMPKQGGQGNTNDGNSSRRAFKSHKLFAEILGLEPWITADLYTILYAISCEFPIDFNKFKEFCENFHTKYIASYKWFNLPVTVHKIIAHGKDIIANSPLALGMFSEQAGESRNKMYKHDRRHHARKCSRTDNLTDVFYRSMDSSDPKISHFALVVRRSKVHLQRLPQEVISLLEAPEPPKQLLPQQLDFSNISESDTTDGADEPFPEYFMEELDSISLEEDSTLQF